MTSSDDIGRRIRQVIFEDQQRTGHKSARKPSLDELDRQRPREQPRRRQVHWYELPRRKGGE